MRTREARIDFPAIRAYTDNNGLQIGGIVQCVFLKSLPADP